jgi:hypothetical protein
MTKSLRLVTVALALFLIGIDDVRAESYQVNYAVKVPAGEATGSMVCHYGKRCIAEMKSLGLKLAISTASDDRDRAHVALDGKKDCCLFEGATRDLAVNPRQLRLQSGLYIGAAARGAEYIENERIGTLYLIFDLGSERPGSGHFNAESSRLSRTPI